MLPDIDTLANLGGTLINAWPVADPSTDLDATADNTSRGNVAMMTRTAARAFRSFVGKASSPPDDPGSNVHDALWGNASGVKPAIVRTGTGVHTITWPTSVTDALGASHTVNIRRAWASVEGATPYHVTVTVTSANVVTVRIFNAAGTANDAVGVTINVFIL